MKKLRTLRAAAVAATLSTAQVALASDAGPPGAGEMQVSGGMLALMVGALVGLGVVVWLVTKMFSK